MKIIYDVIVIGSGAAGFSAVESARAEGAKVCLIEQDRLGGECPNDACVPSKALLKTASIYRQTQHTREFGIQIGAVTFDFAEIMKYRQRVVETITGGGVFGERYEKIFRSLNVDVKKGKAVFVDQHTVEVNGVHLQGKAFVIATGTLEYIPPIVGLETVKYLRWKEAMQLKRLPKSLAIIGGGPVGCELATFFSSFGVRIVLLQSASRVLHREDAEISALAREALSDLKIEILTNANVVEVINGGVGAYGLKVDVAGNRTMHAVEQIVLAAGKRANTDGLGLEKAGVRLDSRGNIVTSKEQKSSVAHIFAAGDVDDGMMFTHTAHHEGFVAGRNAALLAKKKRAPRSRSDERVVPRCTFIAPEVASVGMTQEEAKEAIGKALIGRSQIAALGRAVTDNTRVGMLKIVAHPKTRKALGGHMIGERAGEVIHEIALAIHLGATVDKLACMIHAYPTYSEIVSVAASNVRLE
jgi:mercuric reductase